MSDGETVQAVQAASLLFPVLGVLLCFLVAGTLSAMVTVLQMQRQNLLDEEDLPRGTGRLLGHARRLALALSTVHLLAAVLAAMFLPSALGAAAAGWPWAIWAGVWVAFFLVLLIGTILTKAAALSRPLAFLRGSLPLSWILLLVLWPWTQLLRWMVARVAPRISALDISPPLSGVEMRALLAEEDAEVELEGEERNLVRSIFDLRDTEIREIMVPRVDVKGLDVESTFEEAEAYAVSQPYTRFPVWQGSQDNILGLLHSKDLLEARTLRRTPTVRELLRLVHFLPESKTVDEALREFREQRVHLAVVVDEYGGTAGIVTMEDILEEIVGEIRDEFDEEGERIRLLDEHRAVLDPRVDLDDLNELLDLHLPTEDSDTLGGFLYAELGRVPSRGDTVVHEDLHFTIDRIERQRILQVTLRSDKPLKPHEDLAPPEGADPAAGRSPG